MRIVIFINILFLLHVFDFCYGGFLSDVFGSKKRPTPERVLEAHFEQPLVKVVGTETGLSTVGKTVEGGSAISTGRKNINDDYCDFGADEPGTSACSGSNGDSDTREPSRIGFYCTNMGFREVVIPSSRVDDGVCDCCDGSDEGRYVTCRDTCAEEAEAHRESTKARRDIFMTGKELRTALVDSASDNMSNRAVAVQSLGEEIASLTSQQVTLQAAHDAALEAHQIKRKDLRKETCMALQFLLRDMEGNTLSQQVITDVIKALLQSLGVDGEDLRDLINNWRLGDNAVESALAEDNDDGPYVDEEEDEEEVRKGGTSDVAVSPTGDTEDTPSDSADIASLLSNEADVVDFLLHILAKRKSYSQLQCILAYNAMYGTVQGADVNRFVLKHNENSKDEQLCVNIFSEINDPVVLETFCTLHKAFQKLVNDLLYATFDVDDTDLMAVKNLISEKVEEQNEFDAFREHFEAHAAADATAFISLQDQCYSHKHSKYEYKVCFGAEGSATQKDLENDSVTTLGTFDAVSTDAELGITKMSFKDGSHCWNHGARIANVRISCGKATSLDAVSEPSTCVYDLEMVSQAACSDSVRDAWDL